MAQGRGGTLLRNLRLRLGVQGERATVSAIERTERAIGELGDESQQTASQLGRARDAAVGFSTGIESSLEPIDAMFAGQRRLLGIAGDLAGAIAIGGGILGAGLVPTLASLVGVTVDATSETDKLAEAQQKASESSSKLAQAIGTEVAFISLRRSAESSLTQQMIQESKARADMRLADYQKVEQQLADLRTAARDQERAQDTARSRRRTMMVREFGATAAAAEDMAAESNRRQEAEEEKRLKERLSFLDDMQKIEADRLLSLQARAAKERAEELKRVKASYGERLEEIRKLAEAADQIMAPQSGAAGQAAKKSAELVEAASPAWERFVGVLKGVAIETQILAGAAREIQVEFPKISPAIVQAAAEMEAYRATMEQAQARMGQMVAATGQSFAQAAVDAAIFGKSAEEAFNAVANQLLREAAVQAVMEVARGFAALAQSIWPPNALAKKAAEAHFTAAAAFGAIATVAGIGAAATGGVGGGGSAPSAPTATAPTSADLPAGGGGGGAGETIVINYNPRGQALHTADDVGRAITKSLDDYGRTRGRTRADFRRLQRRGV